MGLYWCCNMRNKVNFQRRMIVIVSHESKMYIAEKKDIVTLVIISNFDIIQKD